MRLCRKILIFIAIIAASIIILNIPVTMRQGLNGDVAEKKIPLYVKACGFIYRDYQYGALAKEITSGITGDKDKITAIYEWTVKNIKRHPAGFDIKDDHIWDIIARSYGSSDQQADVFTTLASYAGYEAFWAIADPKDGKKPLVLSFVSMKGEWYMFDVHNQIPYMSKADYLEYMQSLGRDIFKHGLIRRADKQKAFGRLLFEIGISRRRT